MNLPLTAGDQNPLHAAYYADRAVQRSAEILENVQIARDTFRVRLQCPEIAGSILPGQFVMLRLPGNDPLLGRPLALYDTAASVHGSREPTSLDLVYLLLGKMTNRLAKFRPGDRLEVWGPLGNGFPPTSSPHLVMVAGGIGQTPFLALGQEALGRRQYGNLPRNGQSAERVTLCYGVRSRSLLAGVDDFRRAGFEVQISSDDGSVGHHGLVTDLLRRLLDEEVGADRQVVCCGPEPMMRAVASLCAERSVRCLASLETPMACGIGICFSCVAKVRQPNGGWDWKRTCVEGPIFDATMIEW